MGDDTFPPNQATQDRRVLAVPTLATPRCPVAVASAVVSIFPNFLLCPKRKLEVGPPPSRSPMKACLPPLSVKSGQVFLPLRVIAAFVHCRFCRSCFFVDHLLLYWIFGGEERRVFLIPVPFRRPFPFSMRKLQQKDARREAAVRSFSPCSFCACMN